MVPQTMYYQCVKHWESTLDLPKLRIQENAVLIAEAVNLAAKTLDSDFYSLKAMAFTTAAASPDVECWWGRAACCISSTPARGGVGPYIRTAKSAALSRISASNPVYSHDWSGIYRQTW